MRTFSELSQEVQQPLTATTGSSFQTDGQRRSSVHYTYILGLAKRGMDSEATSFLSFYRSVSPLNEKEARRNKQNSHSII